MYGLSAFSTSTVSSFRKRTATSFQWTALPEFWMQVMADSSASFSVPNLSRLLFRILAQTVNALSSEGDCCCVILSTRRSSLSFTISAVLLCAVWGRFRFYQCSGAFLRSGHYSFHYSAETLAQVFVDGKARKTNRQ